MLILVGRKPRNGKSALSGYQRPEFEIIVPCSPVLSRPAKNITVYDVVQAVDPIERIMTCPLGIKDHGIHLCPMHRRLDQAIAAVENAFRKTPIAELVPSAAGSPPLCELPRRRKAHRVRA
jgi:DNA-binding IscR family transcriptional regulator